MGLSWWCEGGDGEGGRGWVKGVDGVDGEREGGGVWVVVGAGQAVEVVAFQRVAWRASYLYLGHPPHRFRRRYTLGTSVRSGNPAAVVVADAITLFTFLSPPQEYNGLVSWVSSGAQSILNATALCAI